MASSYITLSDLVTINDQNLADIDVTDILDEARWGLDWILSMQQDDGGFRHREAVMEWSPEGPADQDETERWIAESTAEITARWDRVIGELVTPLNDSRGARSTAAGRSGPDTSTANPS